MPSNFREFISRFVYENDEAQLAKIEGQIKTSITAIGAAVAAIGGAAIAGINLASNVARTGDEIGKSARNVGVTAEALQQLRYAAEQSGFSAGNLQRALHRLNQAAEAARAGSGDAQEALARLGVTMDDLDTLEPDALFEGIIEGLSNVESNTERTAIAISLFGRTGREIGSLMEEGAAGIAVLRQEAVDLGMVLSNEVIDSAERTNTSMDRLSGVIGGLKNQLGAALLPAIEQIADSISDWRRENGQVIDQKLADWARLLGRAIEITTRSVNGMIRATNWVIDSLGGVDRIVTAVSFGLTVLAVRTIGHLLANAITSLVAYLATVAGSFSMASAASWAFNAALGAIPLLIAGMIVLFAIFADDLRRFLEGEDSAIGRLAERWVSDGTGMFAKLGRLLFDFQENWEMALDLMAFDFDRWAEKIALFVIRLENRFDLFSAKVGRFFIGLEASLPEWLVGDAARRIGLVVADERVAEREQRGEAIDRLSSDRAWEHTQARLEFGSNLRLQREERRVQVDASGDTIVNVTSNTTNPDEVARLVRDQLNSRDRDRVGELARALGNGNK